MSIGLRSPEFDESDVLQGLRHREPRALEQLYERYERPIYTFAYRFVKDRMLAEEITQELFMKVWQAISQYDERQGKLSTWLFTITRNISIDTMRKNKHRDQTSGDSETLELTMDASQNTEHLVQQKWQKEEVRKALTSLSEEQRRVVEMIYMQGLSQREVADQHAIPLGTVKSRARLAFKTLKRKLSRLETFSPL